MNKLIISPHVDDETLGCCSVLDKDSFVYYCGIDESMLPEDPGHRVPISDRMRELENVAGYLGFKYAINRNSKVNFYVLQEFISALEEIINKIKPEFIFIPHPGYNQDHRTIFNALQVALRPNDKNHFIDKVLIYEGIHDFLWAYDPLEVNHFIPLDIERKLKAYSLHVSQVRPMRSLDMLRQLACLRGAMSGRKHAEAFRILRWVSR